MTASIRIYQIRDFIRKTESGELDHARSIRIVRELATAANFHKNHDILLDLRETEAQLDFIAVMDIAAEFAQYKEVFQNKIAVLIPDTPQRAELARQVKTCMGLQGFQFQQFLDFESAIEWLSVVK